MFYISFKQVEHISIEYKSIQVATCYAHTNFLVLKILR